MPRIYISNIIELKKPSLKFYQSKHVKDEVRAVVDYRLLDDVRIYYLSITGVNRPEGKFRLLFFS